jgi:hypothetical protein
VSSPENSADTRIRHLLQVVERHREQRCNELLEQARSQARQVLRQAHTEARARVHQDILEVREQYRQKISFAQARQLTRARQRRQKADRELLMTIMEPLRVALLRRWRRYETRQLWIRALVQQASVTLVSTHWSIEHPADWPLQERTALEVQLNREVQSALRFEAHPSIPAGLRICAGGACVDGTVEGLLRDRTRIEALLLASINARRQDAGDTRP